MDGKKNINSDPKAKVVVMESYTSARNSLSTVVSEQTMNKVLGHIDNPPNGTATLDNFLQNLSRGGQY